MARAVWRITSPAVAAAVAGVLALAHPALAQTGPPLSVIDWLDAETPAAQLPRAPRIAPPRPDRIEEPAVARSGTAPQVTTRALGAAPARNVGLVPPAITGIQPDLWAGSDPQALADQIAQVQESDLPAASALLFTLLLAEATPFAADGPGQDIVTRARVEKLMALGVVDPALALAEQAGAATSPALFDLWAQLSLLVGTEDTACAALARAPYLTTDIGIRIFCAARGGDWDTAALTFGSAGALSLLPRETLDVLDRFLNPDLFEDAPPLPAPRTMDPLTFRLFETIGEPVPTGPLPRAYAVADLRDIAGWKSQLEAAERLTRAGALPDNRLLGLYTDRRPAASGGIWDRVRAVQQFDAALSGGSAAEVSRTLPVVWDQMRSAHLEVAFASVFQDRLADVALTGQATTIAARMGLLSPDYEAVAARLTGDAMPDADAVLLRGVAQGDMAAVPARNIPTEPVPRAIYDAFTTPQARDEWIALARNRQLGEALLGTLASVRDGARGDSRALREALGTLRALGLEDTARRMSLQILLLERGA
jgi:hypothetical protein